MDVFSDPNKFENTGPMFIKCPSVGDYLIFSSYLGIGFGASEKGGKVIFLLFKGTWYEHNLPLLMLGLTSRLT